MLTPLSYFEMNDKAKWVEYQKETMVAHPSPEIVARGAQAWESLSNTSLVEKRRMALGMLTTEFLTALNDVSGRGRLEQLWFISEGNEWSHYCDNVERVFSQFVYKKPFELTEEREVREQWRRKWEFVKFDHGEHYMQKPLMLLTPLSVETLVSALGKVRQSVSEVSDVLSTGGVFDLRCSDVVDLLQSDVFDLRC